VKAYKLRLPCAYRWELYESHNLFGQGSTESGTFEWNTAGANVTLIQNGDKVQAYKVGENVLLHLDLDGNRIEGELAENYKLHKNMTDASLEGKKWILKELMGKQIGVKNEVEETFILFDDMTSRVNGNNGCNVFSGGYTLKLNGQIRMEGIAATLMACPGVAISNTFDQVLNTTDNYTVKDGFLSLNKAKMAPFAKFEFAQSE